MQVFALIAENTAKIVNKALQKIDFFEHNRDLSSKQLKYGLNGMKITRYLRLNNMKN